MTLVRQVAKWWRIFRVGSSSDVQRESRTDSALRVVTSAIPGFEAVTKNVTSKGLCLATTVDLPVGTELDFGLEFSDNGFPVRFTGEVCWVRRQQDGPMEVGINLSASNERSLSVLGKYLQRAA